KSPRLTILLATRLKYLRQFRPVAEQHTRATAYPDELVRSVLPGIAMRGIADPQEGSRVLRSFGASFDGPGKLANASHRPLVVTLTITCSLGLVASTIYVPSVPAIAAALETSVSRVQLTFVAYLAAFAVSMLVLGPLS